MRRRLLFPTQTSKSQSKLWTYRKAQKGGIQRSEASAPGKHRRRHSSSYQQHSHAPIVPHPSPHGKGFGVKRQSRKCSASRSSMTLIEDRITQPALALSSVQPRNYAHRKRRLNRLEVSNRVRPWPDASDTTHNIHY